MEKIFFKLWSYQINQLKSAEKGFGVFGSIVLFFLIAITGLIYFPNMFSRNVKPYMGDAKEHLRWMNRAQEAYFLEHKSLANSIKAFEIEQNPYSEYYSETKYYSYDLEVLEEGIFHYAESEEPKIPSYVGAVFLVESAEDSLTQETVSIVCGEPYNQAADFPTVYLQKPQLKDNLPECPLEMTVVHRSPGFRESWVRWNG